MQVRKLITNQNAETVVNTAESGAVGLIFAMFMGFITVAAHVALFPFTGILGLARSGLLIWRQAKSGKTQTDAKVRLALEIVASLVIGVAVLGGFLWASAFAFAAPIMFTATLAVKTIHTLVMACIHSYKALHEENPILKKQHKQIAKDCFIGFIGGAFVTAAAGLTMIGGWVWWSILGMGGAAIGVSFGGRSLFKAGREALIEGNYVQTHSPAPSPKEGEAGEIELQVRRSDLTLIRKCESAEVVNDIQKVITREPQPSAAAAKKESHEKQHEAVQKRSLPFEESATDLVPVDEKQHDQLRIVWGKGSSSATQERLRSFVSGDSSIESIANRSVMDGHRPHVTTPTLAPFYASSASLTSTPALSCASSISASPMPTLQSLPGANQTPTTSPQGRILEMQSHSRIAIAMRRQPVLLPTAALSAVPALPSSPLPGVIESVQPQEDQMMRGSAPRRLRPLLTTVPEGAHRKEYVSEIAVHGVLRHHQRSESASSNSANEATGLTTGGTGILPHHRGR